MASIPFLARRKLTSTFSAQEVGQIRSALTAAGIQFKIDQDNRSAPLGYGFLSLHKGAPVAAFEYTFYVHKDDYDLAEAAINGCVL